MQLFCRIKIADDLSNENGGLPLVASDFHQIAFNVVRQRLRDKMKHIHSLFDVG